MRRLARRHKEVGIHPVTNECHLRRSEPPLKPFEVARVQHDRGAQAPEVIDEARREFLVLVGRMMQSCHYRLVRAMRSCEHLMMALEIKDMADAPRMPKRAEEGSLRAGTIAPVAPWTLRGRAQLPQDTVGQAWLGHGDGDTAELCNVLWQEAIAGMFPQPSPPIGKIRYVRQAWTSPEQRCAAFRAAATISLPE